jgi:DNA-binding transcriptional LysR family regulator
MITSTAGRPVLSIFKLAGIIVALVVPWVRLRGLERVHEVFRKEEADHVRRVVMDRSLALGLIELGAGWGAVSTFLVRADLQLAMLILLVVGTGLVIDGLRRLRERRPVPPDIALTWSSGASVREVPEP